MKCVEEVGLLKSVFILMTTLPVHSIPRSFSECHEDFTLHPKDGVLPPYTFSWMGVLQYVHVVTGIPIVSKVPRVVLIHRQFVLAASKDVKFLPDRYKLGNVVIDDYERTETECGLTSEQIMNQVKCPRAVIEIPVDKVIYHPENSRFEVAQSLALIKLETPIKSPYVLPLCLPSTEERRRQISVKKVFLVDYISPLPVPTHFDVEIKAKRTLRLLNENECLLIRNNMWWWEGTLLKFTSPFQTLLKHELVLQMLCTSGCGIRSGSPIVAHNPEGPFEIVGISVGGGSCTGKKRMRRRIIANPPVFVDIYPYRTWIVNIITANLIPNTIPGIYGKGFGRRQSLSTGFYTRSKQRQGWRGAWYAVGDSCFMRSKDFRKELYNFYYEVLRINTWSGANVTYLLQLSAGYGTKVLCAKMKMPRRKNPPIVDGIGTYKINITFNAVFFPKIFDFVVGLFGRDSDIRSRIKWIHDDTTASKFEWKTYDDYSKEKGPTLASDSDDDDVQTTTKSPDDWWG